MERTIEGKRIRARDRVRYTYSQQYPNLVGTVILAGNGSLWNVVQWDNMQGITRTLFSGNELRHVRASIGDGNGV